MIRQKDEVQVGNLSWLLLSHYANSRISWQEGELYGKYNHILPLNNGKEDKNVNCEYGKHIVPSVGIC